MINYRRVALIDFAILTALTEEFRYLRSLLPPLEEVSEGITWYRTRLASVSGDNYEIVLAHQDKMGPLDALSLTRAVIDRWDPSHIMLVGIAGSFHKEVKLADVIVGQQVFYYDLAKATDGILKYRPEGYPGSVSLVRQIHAISVSQDETAEWRRVARESARSKIPNLTIKNNDRLERARSALDAHNPSIHVGTVASGSLVIEDPKKKEELLQLHGKLLGTEMEGAGVMHASFFHEEAPKSAIIIKGISDMANKNKAMTDGIRFWRELASENSVRLALSIIKRGRLPATLADQFEIDTVAAPVGEARRILTIPTAPGVAFWAFPRLVLPRGPMSRLELTATIASAAGPVQVLEARLVYRSEGQRIERPVPSASPVQFSTKERIDPQPIELYMMTRTNPDFIAFEVRSGSSVRSVQLNL